MKEITNEADGETPSANMLGYLACKVTVNLQFVLNLILESESKSGR